MRGRVGPHLRYEMGIVASVVAAVAAGIGEAVADAAAVAAAAAGSAADAVASGMELVGAVGEAAGDTMPLLDGEEETIFDAAEATGGGYADEGAVNDPWNWEAAEDSASSRVSGRALASSLAAIGVGAGVATAIGLGVAAKGAAGAAVLRSGQNITLAMEEEEYPELSSLLPDSILAFMTPEEYELASEALKERQAHGGFDPDTLEEAENAVVYASPQGGLPYTTDDPSLLFDVARGDESGPWFLPGAAGQPLTRGMLARARAAREVIERGQEVSRGFRLNPELRRELERTGRALERVYQEVINRQPAGAPLPEEIVRRVVGEALDQGLEAGAGALANVLGGGAIASTLAGLVVFGGKYLIDSYTGPNLPPAAVEIKPELYSQAPWYVRALGGIWKKNKASYIVNDDGRLGVVNIGYYAPEQTDRGLPTTEPWFHFQKRTEDQLENLTEWLKNNWGGVHTYLGPSIEGNFIIGDLVLQEALYRRKWRTGKLKHASAKRRTRDTRPRPRPKRARRARN